MMRRLLLLALVAASCSAGAADTIEPPNVAATSTSTSVSGTSAPSAADPIAISLSLYVVTDANNEADSARSSTRSEEELADIAERIQEIWGSAGIVFDPLTVNTV